MTQKKKQKKKKKKGEPKFKRNSGREEKFGDAAVGLADRLNEENDETEDNTFDVECWNGELVDDVNDCPVDEGNIVCDDGSFAIRISDCPTGSSPPEDDDDRGNSGIQDYAEEEDYEPLPYCDLVSNEYMQSGGTCHDRKDYYQGGPNDGLYPCNDGTDKEDWRDCKDVSYRGLIIID